MPRPELHDYACAIHVHSVHSDGTGTVRQIARAGRRAKVDVVLLTDHDTLAAREQDQEGYHDGLLLLVGAEVSPRGGNHYLAFGIDEPIRHQALSPQEICEAVAEAGGFGFAAHPFSEGSPRFERARPIPWTSLDFPEVRGIELWSFVNDNGQRITSLGDALRFTRNPAKFVEHPPERNLREWDELCAQRKVAALGGIDAHQRGKRILGRVPIRFMSYRRAFSHLRTHVLCESPFSGDVTHDRAQVYEALREGRSFIAMDSFRPAAGFNFWAEHGRAAALAMGADGPATRGWELHARVPETARLRLLRNGHLAGETVGRGLHHHAEEPGAYRVEALLKHKGAERTWILSNPIYLR